MDSHNGTMVYRKANIWYISHNMHLVNQSNVYLTMQRKHKPTRIAEIITYTSITYNYNKSHLTSICLSLINVTIIQQECLTKNKWHKRHKPYTQPLRQWTTRSPPITTVAARFNHNIPSTLLQDHQLRLEYL